MVDNIESMAATFVIVRILFKPGVNFLVYKNACIKKTHVKITRATEIGKKFIDSHGTEGHKHSLAIPLSEITNKINDIIYSKI